MARRKEATPQQIKQQKFSAKKIFDQARVHYEILGKATADPRLPKACETLGLLDPTTEDGLKYIKKRERIGRAAAAGKRSGWNY